MWINYFMIGYNLEFFLFFSRDSAEDDLDMPLHEAAHQNIYMHDRMYTQETIDPSAFLDSVGPVLDERGMEFGMYTVISRVLTTALPRKFA